MIISSVLGLMYASLSIASRQSRKSALMHPQSLWYFESNTGKAWFSWVAKLSKFPVLDWLATYRLENNRPSPFTNFIFSFPFEDIEQL